MRKLFFLITVSFSFFTSAKAQENITLERLIADENIIWAAEYTANIPFNVIPELLNHDRQVYEVTTSGNYRVSDISSDYRDFIWVDNIAFVQLKDIQTPKSPYATMLRFEDYFLEAAKNNNGDFYKDPDLKKRLTKEEIQTSLLLIDTIVNWNPITLEETTIIVRNELNQYDVKFSRVKFYIYYDKKINTWKLTVKSIAPVISRYDNNGEFLDYETLFWLPVYSYDDQQDYSLKNITKAQRTTIHISPDSATAAKREEYAPRVVKLASASLDDCLQYMLDDLEKNPEKHTILSLDMSGDELSNEEIKEIGISVDTIITLDPVTFEEKFEAVIIKPDIKDINQLRFTVDWYWDDKTKKLKTTCIYFYPVRNIFDDWGDFKYRQPMYMEQLGKVLSD